MYYIDWTESHLVQGISNDFGSEIRQAQWDSSWSPGMNSFQSIESTSLNKFNKINNYFSKHSYDWHLVDNCRTFSNWIEQYGQRVDGKYVSVEWIRQIKGKYVMGSPPSTKLVHIWRVSFRSLLFVLQNITTD